MKLPDTSPESQEQDGSERNVEAYFGLYVEAFSDATMIR